MDVRFLDALYAEKHSAMAKLTYLKGVDAFAACDKCGGSDGYSRHCAEVKAAQARLDLAILLIGEYVKTHAARAA